MFEWLRRRRDPRLSVPVEAARYVVMDLETTGLDVAKDRMISVAAVGLRGGAVRLDDVLELHVRPTVPLRPQSIPIHGLLPADVEGGVDEQQAVERVDAFVDTSVVVGHHIRFDVTVLDRARGRPSRWLTVDTALLAVRLQHGPATGYAEVKPPTLDQLARDLGVDIRNRHTAAGDVLVTAEVFLTLVARFRRQGIQTVGELIR